MKVQRAYGWAALLLAMVVAAGSTLRRSITAGLQTHGTVHLAVHVLLFTLLTGLLMKSTPSLAVRGLLYVGAVLLGFGTEWLEHLKDGYPVERPDVLADTAGASIALLASLVASLLARGPQEMQEE